MATASIGCVSGVPSASASHHTQIAMSEATFTWRLDNLGLVFENEDTVLHSPVFYCPPPAGDGQTGPSRWRLRAYCARQCPESMIRVYARLLNVDEEEDEANKLKGRFALKSFYKDSELDEHRKLEEAEKEEGGLCGKNLTYLDPKASKFHFQDIFLGWAGKVSEYVGKLVYAKVRVFGRLPEEVMPESEERAVVKAETINKRLSVYSEEDEEKWREFIYLIYQKLLENIQQKLKEQQMAEWDKAFNRTIKYEVKGQKVKGHLHQPLLPEVVVGPQYQEYAVKVYQKLVELVRSKLGDAGRGFGQFGSGKVEGGVTEIAMSPSFMPTSNVGLGGCKVTSL